MRRALLARAAALAATGLIVMGWPAAPAAAALPAGPWDGDTGPGASATATTDEDVDVTVAVSGDHLELAGLDAAPLGGPTENMFTPPVPVDGGWLKLSVLDTDCAPDTTCDRGPLTVTFSDPVVDPVVFLSGLGSHQNPDTVPAGTAELSLAGSTPAGATLGQPAPGAVNLTVADDLIQAANPPTATAFCADGAGCGAVPVSGTVTELTFDVALYNILENVIGDGIAVLVAGPELVEPAEPAEPAEPVEPGELPDTGVPALALLGLGAAGLLAGSFLLAVRTRGRLPGSHRA